jgi:glycosyltransferase involved in cell wall biosynthesis
VLSVWGSDVYEFPDRSRWHRRLLKANLRAADWVCSTSNAMAGRTLEISPGISNLSITPFGIDTNRFAPTPRAASRRVVTVGTVKKLESIYGIDILLKAFASAKTSIARKSPELDLRLKIVGSGSERTALQGLAAELSIVDSTEFVGRVPNEDVPKHLGQIDVYVALSRCQESFGVAILEASSCAVPVIVSDVGGFPEVVEDGSTGLIVNNEDAADASAAIERLVLDEGMRRRLGDAGRKMVMKRYEWSDSVTIMEDVYGRVLAGHAKARHDK